MGTLGSQRLDRAGEKRRGQGGRPEGGGSVKDESGEKHRLGEQGQKLFGSKRGERAVNSRSRRGEPVRGRLGEKGRQGLASCGALCLSPA